MSTLRIILYVCVSFPPSLSQHTTNPTDSPRFEPIESYVMFPFPHSLQTTSDKYTAHPGMILPVYRLPLRYGVLRASGWT